MRALIIAGALALAGCGVQLPTPSLNAPAPLAATTIDEQKLDLVWRTYDAALDAVNLLIDRKVITPGSAKAVRIADINDRILAALTAAEKARAALSTTSYKAALDDAKAAIADLRVALRSN